MKDPYTDDMFIPTSDLSDEPLLTEDEMREINEESYADVIKNKK